MERLSRGRAQRIASSIAKWNENGLKMLPRGLPNRSKIAPRWPPESANGSGDLSCSFFWPLGRLSGRSWVALGRSWRLLGRAWPSWGAPGSHFRHPGASFGTCLGLFLRRLWKNTETLIFDDSCSENQGLGVPGGSKIDPRWLPKSLLGASWRLLALSWRLSALSWRLLAASWRLLGPLGRLLGRS